MQNLARGVFLLLLMSSSAVHANICGTDYQNFNPTTSGLDFVTVQSSETLKPCIVNMGAFLNYAANSLTYSKTLLSGPNRGSKAEDRILGMDLSIGYGVSERWDVGANIPFILNQKVEDDLYVSSYKETGATEIKLNTRYHILGDESGGLAGLFSVNQNLINDNPFAGQNPGPTLNFEMAADTTLAKKWALGLNFGYRKRNPGDPIAGVPFVPMEDQWIYSGAASYLLSKIDTKVILEVFGSRVVDKTDQDTDRNLNALEGLIGLKHDTSINMAVHAGAGMQLDNSLGGPDWRLYLGMNWAMGPICDQEAETPPPLVAQNAEEKSVETQSQVEVFQVNVELLFAVNSDKLDYSRMGQLETFIKEITARPYEKIQVDGHTDSLGSEEYNVELSQRRADNFREYLISHFKLPPEKIFAIGYGPLYPIADNGNYQGRRKNRRVELKVWHKTKP